MTNYEWLIRNDKMVEFISDIVAKGVRANYSKYKIPFVPWKDVPHEAVTYWLNEEHRDTGIYVKRDDVIAALQIVRFPGGGVKRKYTLDEVRSIIVDNANKWISAVNELDTRELDE